MYNNFYEKYEPGGMVGLTENGSEDSDAGAVCGLNPYVSSIEVYLNK